MGSMVDWQPLSVVEGVVVKVIAWVGRPLAGEGGGSVGDTRVKGCSLPAGVAWGLGSNCKGRGRRRGDYLATECSQMANK